MTPQEFNTMDKMLRSNPSEELSKQALESIGIMQKKIGIPPMPEPFIKTNMPTSEAAILLVVDGQEYGPYTKPEILELISKGAITTETLMWRSGMLEWMPISKVPDLV
ncbi:MAG: DUF4339 domain-containing protein [Bacteroidales bacterium]|nr:DUF4339 domain-containing protein [Bacteroidales bacterium]